MPDKKQRWQVYILQCKNGSLYTGMTCDVERRYKEHVRGGSRYTSYNPPLRLVYTEDCYDRAGALKRELKIKSYTRAKKLSTYQRIHARQKGRPMSAPTRKTI